MQFIEDMLVLGSEIKENLRAVADVFDTLGRAYVPQVVHHFAIFYLHHVASLAFSQAKQTDTLI